MNIDILPSVNFTKQKRVAKPVTSVFSRIIRFMNNQTKKPEKGFCSQKRRESNDKNAVAIVKIVPQMGCVSQDSKPFVSQRGKQSQRNPMLKVLGSIRKVRFTLSTLRQTNIRENRGPSLGKMQVKLPHQRSPYALKFEDRSQEETARQQQRCAQSKDKTTFFSPAEERVLPAASKKELEERECGGFRSGYAYGQQARP